MESSKSNNDNAIQRKEYWNNNKRLITVLPITELTLLREQDMIQKIGNFYRKHKQVLSYFKNLLLEIIYGIRWTKCDKR